MTTRPIDRGMASRTGPRIPWLRISVLCSLLIIAGCGGGGGRISPAPPGPSEPSEPPSVSRGPVCPIDQVVASPDGLPVFLNYDVPALGNAGQSTDTVCSPAPGSLLEVGRYEVRCESSADPTRYCAFSARVVTGGICARTAQVRDAIVSRIPEVDNCGDVTDSHLAGLTGDLSLRFTGLSALQSGDFAGLGNLQRLFLSNNQLTTLPADIFSGMSSLTTLRLHTNQLKSLPSNLFDDLTDLDILDLEFNNLTTLPSDLFAGMDLFFLGLEANQFPSFPTGLFDSLNVRQSLDLSHNMLASLESDVFDGLSELRFLDLAHNQLNTLPAGIFSGLFGLKELFLEENPGSNFVLTMSLERVTGTDKVVVVVPEGAPYDMTTTISVTGGGTLPPGVSTVTVPIGETKSAEITITSLDGSTVSLGTAPTHPTAKYLGFVVRVAGPLSVSGFSGRSLSSANIVTDLDAVLSVTDAQIGEDSDAVLSFSVTLNPAQTGTVTVDYATSDGTATAGSDYVSTSGTLIFTPGETGKTVLVPVLKDEHSEGNETLALTLSNPSGAALANRTATGTITGADPIPQAWLARFGRTAADQVLEAVAGRLRTARSAGIQASLGGLGISTISRTGAQSMTVRELLPGSSFSLAAETKDNEIAAFWGRISRSSFTGREGSLKLDGNLTAGFLGIDYARGRWTTGLMVSHSTGSGGYLRDGGGENSGDIQAAVTALTPWAGYAVTERLSAWGAAGYGKGRLIAKTGQETVLRTGLSMVLAAAGARGILAGSRTGRRLEAVTDARWTRTDSGRVSATGDNPSAVSAEVMRVRLGLDGTWPLTSGTGTMVTPQFRLGVRHDGGDAEAGYGIYIAGGMAIAAPARGITLSLESRSVLAHDAADLRDRGIAGTLAWDPSPASGRGPKLSLSHIPGPVNRHMLLNGGILNGLPAGNNGDGLHHRHLDARFGYGLAVFGGRFTSSPEIGLNLSATGRSYSLGWRLTRAGQNSGTFELSIEGRRRESSDVTAAPGHDIGLRLMGRW